jgi:hypothetical protein
MRVAAAGSRTSLLLLGAVVLAVARAERVGRRTDNSRDRSERYINRLKFPTDRIGYINLVIV